jgi:hypothetical protein
MVALIVKFNKKGCLRVEAALLFILFFRDYLCTFSTLLVVPSLVITLTI